MEDVCKQLAQVAGALTDALFPTPATRASSSSSSSSSSAGHGSSNTAPPLQQVASQALAWRITAGLMHAAIVLKGEESIQPVLVGSGLLQVMLEGTLALFTPDPAVVYADGPADLLWDYLALSNKAALMLGMSIGNKIAAAWYAEHTRGGRLINAHGSSYAPWMVPMFKLQVLLLSKLQWDVRQHLDDFIEDRVHVTWPTPGLPRAVSQMVSSCVAGDLLQQRAPGLVPYFYTHPRLVYGRSGLTPAVVEENFPTIPSCTVAVSLSMAWICVNQCSQAGKVFDVMEALDLALLLEVVELYCQVCPPGLTGQVFMDACGLLQYAVAVSPYHAHARFADTSAAALLSIAEHLVEDVLLVSQGSAGGGANAGLTTTTSGASGNTSKPDTCSTGGRGQGRSSSGGGSGGGSSSSSSNSSSSRRPWSGGGSPMVTFNHHVQWAQDTVATLGKLMMRQVGVLEDLPDSSSYFESDGYGVGVVHSLLTSSTAPRLSRLLEVAQRTPGLQGQRLHNLPALLPWRLPVLYVAASSPTGSRDLLCAAATVAKAQQVRSAAMSALVDSGGHPAPAAARLAAAVPGRMGQWVAAQVLQQPSQVLFEVVQQGTQLAFIAQKLFVRAAALLDPALAPLAAYLASQWLPSEQSSKPWAVEAVVNGGSWLGHKHGLLNYHYHLVFEPAHLAGVTEGMAAALSQHHAAAAHKQATKLAKAAGGGAAEVEQLRCQLQNMWLRRDGASPSGLGGTERKQLAAGGAPCQPTITSTDCAAHSASSSSSAGAHTGRAEVPQILQNMCTVGAFKLDQVLAAGDPAQWSTALGPSSEKDLWVASSALVAACKLAAALAQLPMLLQQVQPIMAQQLWGRELVDNRDMFDARNSLIVQQCGKVADWALLLAPVLAMLLPAEQAAELQKAAADVQRNAAGMVQLTNATVTHVLGLLQHVVVPGVPGCSYPSCCNLEGRSEAELPTQVCSKCRGARYCCREHQAAHWKAGHKQACQAAAAAAQKVQRLATEGRA